MSEVRVIWMKKVRDRYGKTVQRVPATLVAVTEEWCTVEVENGERHAARTEDVRLMKKACA
jgi:hypothetical protein